MRSVAKWLTPALLATSAVGLAGDATDARRGEILFLQCQACHALNAEAAPRVGPHLQDIVGKPAASVDGYEYSSALVESGIVWNVDALSAWMENPTRFVPGSKMAIAGIPDAADRAAIIAYLRDAAGETTPSTSADSD